MTPITIEGKEFAIIPMDLYDALMDDADWLVCLEAAGVDNWEGYDAARALQRGEDMY